MADSLFCRGQYSRFPPKLFTTNSLTMSVPYDFDASPIPGQQGWAVLDLKGQTVRNNGLALEDAGVLFKMFQESASLMSEEEGFRRLMVNYSETRFLVTRDENHVYLVQARVG